MVAMPTSEDYKDLIAKVDQMTLAIKMLSFGVSAPQNMTVQMIAKIEGVSVSHLYGAGAYLLPRFGESAFPTGPNRWPTQEYDKWRSIDPTQRYDMYITHLEGLNR